jgi:hypothetical protein
MTTATRLRVGTGLASLPDAHAAGTAAARDALASLEGMPPALVMVFCTPRYELAALLAGIREVTGDAPLVGCTGSGEMIGGTYLGFGGGVGVLALAGGPYRFAAASRAGIDGDLDAAGRELAREARDRCEPGAHAVALLLTDSLLGDLQQFVQGVYRVAGPTVAIAGGAAGDEQRWVRSSLFHDGEILDKGALVLWITGDRPFEVAMRHGWEPVGAPLIVTRAAGTHIAELGGRPAADAYEAELGLAEPLPGDGFWPVSMRHPFGLQQPDGSHVIRTARMKDDQGVLTIQGCVPQVGSVVQVMEGSGASLLSVVPTVAGEALAANPDAGVLLAFSCAARAVILGPRAAEEAEGLQAAAGAVPVFGFYCCGEFARTSGVLATHNATLTAIAL